MCVSHFVILSAYLLIVVWSVVHVVFSIHKIIHAWCFFSVCVVCVWSLSSCSQTFASQQCIDLHHLFFNVAFFFFFYFGAHLLSNKYIHANDGMVTTTFDWMQTTECCRMMMRWSARTRNKPESSRYNNLYRLLMWNKSRMISSSLDVRTSDSLICIHFVFICV